MPSPQPEESSTFEDVYRGIGEFGLYQFVLFLLIGSVSFIPSVVAYGYSFYGAVPEFRCKVPNLTNDTYEIWGQYQQDLIDAYIPLNTNPKLKDHFDKCHIKSYWSNESPFSNSSNFTLNTCSEYVYSKEYYGNTLMSEWNFVCDEANKRSLISTLFFVGTFGVFVNGMMSDKFGRQRTILIFMVANAVVHILLAVLANTRFVGVGVNQVLFVILRMLSGTTSYTYTTAVVLTIELCGPSKRVLAVNTIYYFYITGEFVVVLMAYILRDYNWFLVANAAFLSSFLVYFWIVPESPRWLMTKQRYSDAYNVFKLIANANKKPLDCLKDIKILSEKQNSYKNAVFYNSVDVKSEELDLNVQEKEPHISYLQTFKILFKSRKLVLTTAVTLLSWLVNTLVYYGISFNTAELAGNPYLNFTLSAVVEIFAITTCHFTLDRFGRKIPYAVNMLLSGLALLMVQFVPTNMSYIVTILALVAKFAISFTFNSIYMITAELYPTVIRNSAVSICQGFGRFGAVISPQIELLGSQVWYPLPFIIYGASATISAFAFILVMPETKGRQLPDSIEEFVQKNE